MILRAKDTQENLILKFFDTEINIFNFIDTNQNLIFLNLKCL